jgi:hypothetical protein
MNERECHIDYIASENITRLNALKTFEIFSFYRLLRAPGAHYKALKQLFLSQRLGHGGAG